MANGSQPLHLGFVFYDFSDSRAVEVIRGISSVLGADKISYFPTGPLNKAELVEVNHREKILTTIHNAKLDGLISLQFWESEKWFLDIGKQYFNCPSVPLLRTYAQAPGVTCDYHSGAYEAVKHLLSEHHCRKPYYLQGSRSTVKNLEDRFSGYQQALAEFNIPFDDSMKISLEGTYAIDGIATGALHYGGKAIDILFKQRGLVAGKDIDSLVIFNDSMASEAIEALQQLGLKVPDDIRVISFDNTLDSETGPVALTTSAIDWYSLGVQGVALVRQRIEQQNATAIEVSPSLIVRSSCGCTNALSQLINSESEQSSATDRKALIDKMILEDQTKNKLLESSVSSMRYSSIMRNAAMMLAKCYDLEAFSESCSVLLNYLNIEQCSLYLATPKKEGQYNRQLHWRNGCKDYSYLESPASLEELSEFIGLEKISVCETLDQGDEHIGFLLFGSSDNEFISFGELKGLMSNSLHSLLLLENLKLAQEKLELTQREKLASVERLVAGVAHDVNTPLGIGVTAASALVEDTRALKDKFDTGTLSKQAFIDALEHLTETSEIVQKNLVRASDLVRSFKNVSVKNSGDTIDTFNVKQHLNDVVVTMSPRFKRKKVVIDVNCSADFEIYNNPGALSQILVNLITNSLTHGFADLDSGEISISVSEEKDNQLLLEYKDNGAGMTEDVLQKVYEPFFTTKGDQGGSGLGMFMVSNLVEQKLNGRLDVSSTLGEGVTFSIYFPKKLPTMLREN